MTVYDQDTGEVIKSDGAGDLIETPGPIALTETSLAVDGELSFDEWCAFGQSLQQVEGAIQWWIGDWLTYGERAFGETYTQAIEETGMTYQRLANYAYVASNIDFSSREEKLSFTHHSLVAKCEPEEQRYWLDRAEAECWSVADLRKHMKQSPWLSSDSNEWYTPPRYIEAARAVLGHFDVDPASNETAQQIIKAATYYTAETNGLDKEWDGKVWMNPPYGGLSGPFVERMIEQFEEGIVTEAIVLVNSNSTETNWFAPLWGYMLCFTDHRINFETPGGAKNGSTHGSVFVYLGSNEDAFRDQFSQFGYIVKQV